MTAADLCRNVEFLVGTSCKPPNDDYFNQVAGEIDSLDDVTFDQLTRILIASGEDRIERPFFAFFRSLGVSYSARVARWRELSILHFGNFRFPFKRFRDASDDDFVRVFGIASTQLEERTTFGDGLRPIPLESTPLLGYIAGAPAKALQTKLENEVALTAQEQGFLERFDDARRDGIHNTYEYVCMPWIDVYVATSMRASEDFYSVARFLGALFGMDTGDFSNLDKVGYFDPTQSFHDDRIVKGIVEGLMLKRAACTLYLAQETDTLGKDSELATTLAQGKPVIAYVPSVSEIDSNTVIDDLKRAAADEMLEVAETPPEYARLVDRFAQLLVHEDFRNAWNELELGEGIVDQQTFDLSAHRFVQELVKLYDRRAQTLLYQHPLALQINLDTGVANGILVARTTDACRSLIRQILDDTMRFRIEARDRADNSPRSDLEAPIEWDRYLVEASTSSVFRVVVADELIANAFWNWYLNNDLTIYEGEPVKIIPKGWVEVASRVRRGWTVTEFDEALGEVKGTIEAEAALENGLLRIPVCWDRGGTPLRSVVEMPIAQRTISHIDSNVLITGVGSALLLAPNG